MSDSDQPSSARSLADRASAAIQEGIAKITGNRDETAAAERKKESAKSEWDASHAATKVGPTTTTYSGTHVDNQDRREGQWKETVGSAKESVGSMVGHKDLQQSGRDQSSEGQAQSTVGQASDWVQGSVDRMRGSVKTSAAGLFDDPEEVAKSQKLHDQGKAQQRSAEQ